MDPRFDLRPWSKLEVDSADALEVVDEFLEANPKCLMPHLWPMLELFLQSHSLSRSLFPWVPLLCQSPSPSSEPGHALGLPWPQAGLSHLHPRPHPSRHGLTSTRLWLYWRWCCWMDISAWSGIASLWLRLSRHRPRTRPRPQHGPRPQPRPLALAPRCALATVLVLVLAPARPVEHTHGTAAPAACVAVSQARAPPLGSAVAGPEPLLSRSKERTPGAARPGAAEGCSGLMSGPGPSADSRVSLAGEAQHGTKERYQLGLLLGCGGFGSAWAVTRLSDGALVAIKRVPWNHVQHWGKLPDGTSAPLEIVLLDKVSTGFPGVLQLLEWLELPNNILMVLEHPEWCQDLRHFIWSQGFLSEEVAQELFCQVLEAVQHCTSCGVLHRDIKPENILLDLATWQAKLIDFGSGTYLQDTAYTHFTGEPTQGCPPEWTHFGWYYGKPATLWSLGILLHQMVCGEHPFRRGQNISWNHQLSLPQQVSQECQDLIRWCLSMLHMERPSSEDLFCDPWMQQIHLP
ncbi:serine/threonine-protein kinase pim-1-like [Cinclus cinclus]|uniref:serine/threonine-protein kinase pim-1-like n=1 Tax=Cinclus cinclus TaxID=127875 RepID=UPI002E168351